MSIPGKTPKLEIPWNFQEHVTHALILWHHITELLILNISRQFSILFLGESLIFYMWIGGCFNWKQLKLVLLEQ